MATVRPDESGHGIISCSGDPGNGTSGPIRVFKPTVSPLTMPLVYCSIDLQKMNWKFQAGFHEHTGVSLHALIGFRGLLLHHGPRSAPPE